MVASSTDGMAVTEKVTSYAENSRPQALLSTATEHTAPHCSLQRIVAHVDRSGVREDPTRAARSDHEIARNSCAACSTVIPLTTWPLAVVTVTLDMSG